MTDEESTENTTCKTAECSTSCGNTGTTETTGIPGEQPGAPNPSLAGVDKNSGADPDIRVPGAQLPLPEGVSIAIPKVWMHSLTGSPQNSLTDPSIDEPSITISKKTIEEYGSNGMDEINFRIVGELTAFPAKANIAYAVAWDPEQYPDNALLAQGNLPLGSTPRWDRRVAYLPDYPFMRPIGTHTLRIAAQLRSDAQHGRSNQAGDLKAWSEFPHYGPTVIRDIKISVTE